MLDGPDSDMVNTNATAEKKKKKEMKNLMKI